MKLVKLTANKSTFKPIIFNDNGISLILGKKTAPGEERDSNSNTINGIGKTLTSYLVGYCLGSNSNNSFEKEIPDWSFKLEFTIDDETYIVKRKVNEQDSVFLNGEKNSLYDYNNSLRELFFKESVGIKNLGLRPLFKRFVRTDKESYNSYDKVDTYEYGNTKVIRNGYLLGLDLDLITKKVNLKEELDDLKQTKKKLSSDDLIQKFINEENSIKKSKEELVWEQKRIVEVLSDYKIAENYSKIESDAEQIYSQLVSLKNKKFSLQNDLYGIDKTLQINPDLDHNTIKAMYDEVNKYFNEELTKSVQDVSNFYENLRNRRNKRLYERKKYLLDEYQELEKEINFLQQNYDELIKYLDTHGALDEYHELKEYEKSLSRDIEKLDSYKGLIAQVDKKINQVKENFIVQDQLTNDYLESHSEELDELKLQFVSFVKEIYPDKGCGLDIDNNTGENKSRFDINAYIHSDTSDGISEVLIFCYDLLLLTIKKNHILDFLFHDSRLFSDVDPRQRASMFKLAYNISSQKNKQYIASVNEDQLETIREYFQSQDEYQEIIEDNIVLTLKDDSPESKLLGVDVELEY